ncbi:hypothetical protein HLV40_15160 [Chromohalobacter salexigens]|nr:hypothetical protein [Chromohalobacter salexigens]
MRWIVVSIATLLIAGCGGLERQKYPAAANDPLVVGKVTHVQPYTGETSESGWSRAGWGALAGGVIVGAVAGLTAPDAGSFDAYSYLVNPVGKTDQAQIFNAFDDLKVGACVAIYQSVRKGMYSLSQLPSGRCDI